MLTIADKTFASRLFTGTGKFGSAAIMEEAILASASELVTVALKRVELPGRTKNLSGVATPDGSRVITPSPRVTTPSPRVTAPAQQVTAPAQQVTAPAQQVTAPDAEQNNLLHYLRHPHIHLLPNTSGVRNAKEAIFAAELAREALRTNWLKLEIHPDPRWLLPDPIETLLAAEELVKRGFVVLPYIHADPVLCKRLEEVGVAAVMPLGSPIGSNKGLKTADFLEIIIAQSRIPVIVDAGIGAPSDAARALEMGADAVLVNTAIAASPHPVQMGQAFKLAVEAGRMAYEARLAVTSPYAVASSPLTAFLDE